MSKLLTGIIDLSKIDKSTLFKSEKTGRTYLNVNVWINDEEDKYGNIASVSQYFGKDKDVNYIGNLKEFKKSNTKETPSEDLPF